MFKTAGSVVGFIFGIGLTVGLLLSPHLFPCGSLYGVSLRWRDIQILAAISLGLSILALTLWVAGKMIRGAESWKETKVIVGAVLIAAVANTLYSFMVDFFAFRSGLRALVAPLGVPVIYGNLGAVLRKTRLRTSMVNIFSGTLMVMGAGSIIVALIRGWQ